MKNKKHEWLTVITISFIISVINIFHVIIGLAKTPAGFTYLATGHYYPDYFEYLQHISAGMAGHWAPTNYYTIDPTMIDWRFFPYIILGKIASIFNLSPMAIYWISVFLLTFFTLMGFYYLINLMIPKEKFYVKITAFFISIFSGPVYQVFVSNNQILFKPYDFWYGPASFIRRFGVVPYHTLGLLLLIIIVILVSKIWKNITDLSKKEIIIKGALISLLLIALMTFSPFPLLSLLPALIIISAICFIKFKNYRLNLLLFNTLIFIFIVPVGILLRRNTGYGGMNFEIKWISHDPWWFVFLNLGPIILFFPFGLKDYLKENNFLNQILLIFSLVSYCLFVLPVAQLLGTHNLRFFSSISYICYGVLAVMGIKKISSIFKKNSHKIFTLISIFLILYSGLLVFYSLEKRLLGQDMGVPETIWTYLPNPIIEGLQSLKSYPKGNVLAGPYGGTGVFVPIFSNRRVYIGNQMGTINIEKKLPIAYRFYAGQMTKNEALSFIKNNNIKFVILTYYDNFDSKIINKYDFLKIIFLKPSMTVWKINI